VADPAVVSDDLDDTARLILIDDPKIGLAGFIRLLRRNTTGDVDVHSVNAVWKRYRGSHNQRPTHDVLTGQEL
jgi:hypothetical protein